MPHDSIRQLVDQIQIGDFVHAKTSLETALKRVNELRRLPRDKPSRMAAAGALAEVLFYLGRNDEARALIFDAASRETWLELDDRVPPRARLQLVEYYYSLRDFQEAKLLARRLLRQWTEVDERLGAADAAYYMARAAMRQHQTTDVFEACRESLRHLAAAQVPAAHKRPSSSNQLLALQWRMGLVLLVSGFSASKDGHATGWSDLFAAKALLAQTGDVVGHANVDVALGAALRSRATREDRHLAREAFAGALDVYMGMDHKLNIARARTHLGRTYLDLEQWAEAKKQFEEALSAINEVSDSASKSRQRAECLVWKAWLHRSAEKPKVENAISSAREALVELDKLHHSSIPVLAGEISVEAYIVLADCDRANDNDQGARDSLQKALKIADERSIGKLKVNVLLSLAALEASKGDVVAAFGHYKDAVRMLTKDSSAFLRRKARHVKEQIESRNDAMWVVTEEELLSKGGLLRAIADLERWGVGRVERQLADKSLRAKAETVGLQSGPGYLKLVRRVGTQAAAKIELPAVPGGG